MLGAVIGLWANIPILLLESLALAMGDKLPVLSFVPIILDVSFLKGVQFGFWSGSQLRRGQDIRSLDFSLCYQCCLCSAS